MSAQPRGSAQSGAGAGVMLVVLAAVVGGGSLVVAIAGALGAVLAGHTPVLVGFNDAADVLARLPRHLDDPAAAWPAAVRDELPGRTAMLAALGIALALLVLLAAAILWALDRLTGGADRRRSQAARWANPRELARLRVKGPQRGRVILGRRGRVLLAGEPRTSVLVVGPAQSGKTTGLAVPAILEWDGPVLVTSVKADAARDTFAARARVGKVTVFDPTGSSGLPTSVWSPIAASRTWEAARRTAAGLLVIREDTFGTSADDRFWKPAAARYLAPLLLAAAHDARTMGDVLRWIAHTEQDEVRAALEACPDEAADVALDALASVWAADERFRSSVLQTLATAVDPWLEPAVARATSSAGGIDAGWLLDGPNTVYLSAPAHDQQRLRGLFTALIGAVVAEAFARSSRSGAPIDPPLLLCLDEAANIAPLPNLGEIASTAPGQGVQLLTVLQNKSQADDAWGRDRAETIIANHVARVFCSGIGDRATLDYLGAVLGDEEVEKVSTHRQRLELDAGSRTYSKDFRRLAAPDRVRQAERDTALLVYGNLPPAWIGLRPWYRDKRLTAQVAALPTQPAARAGRPLAPTSAPPGAIMGETAAEPAP
jgi:type IV secretion system protein VirD4